MLVAAFIMKQVGLPSIGREQDVQRTVVVDIGIGCAAGHFRAGEACAQRTSDLLKFAPAKIPKHMRRLSISDPLLDALDLILNVSVDDENVGPAIIVVVKEKAPEAERYQGCSTDLGSGGLVDK